MRKTQERREKREEKEKEEKKKEERKEEEKREKQEKRERDGEEKRKEKGKRKTPLHQGETRHATQYPLNDSVSLSLFSLSFLSLSPCRFSLRLLHLPLHFLSFVCESVFLVRVGHSMRYTHVDGERRGKRREWRKKRKKRRKKKRGREVFSWKEKRRETTRMCECPCVPQNTTTTNAVKERKREREREEERIPT